MNHNRLLSGVLIVMTAVLTVTGTVWLMHSSPQEKSAQVSMPLVAERSGTIDANPFGTGEFAGPVPPPVQTADAGTGIFRADEKGELILDHGTKIRLDILLAELPANPTRNELQTIETSAVAGLPQQAAQKALRIVDGYARYLKAERELNAGLSGESTAQPQDMFNKFVALRRQHLGAQVADAFFAAQEIEERVGIQIAVLDADPKLTAQEKLARLDELKRGLPQTAPGLHADLDASRAALTMEQDVAALRQQGAPEEQVHQLRERHVGPEAAQSIGEMEVQKNDWEHRQQTFSQQKNAISQLNLTAQQKQERIEALLSQIYTEEEIPSARAYHQLQIRR